MKVYPIMEFDRSLTKVGYTDHQIDQIEAEIRFLMPEFISHEPVEMTEGEAQDYRRRIGNNCVLKKLPFEQALQAIHQAMEKISRTN